MDNPEKLATQVTQDEDKQNKNITQYVLETTIHNSNMTSFKRFESKPVVKIILIYDRLNL